MKRKYSTEQQQSSKEQQLLRKQQQQSSLTQISPNIMVDMTILSQTNQRIQKKCPDLHMQLTIQDPENWLLELYKEQLLVSVIKIHVAKTTMTISSDTYGIENRNRKYNSLLRSVLLLLALSIDYRSKPIDFIVSTAINWKTVKTLHQRHFVPTQIFTTTPPYFQAINQKVFKILQNTQTLKKMLSGDEHDEQKPWVYVRMELDLQQERDNIRRSTQTSLTHTISQMKC